MCETFQENFFPRVKLRENWASQKKFSPAKTSFQRVFVQPQEAKVQKVLNYFHFISSESKKNKNNKELIKD